MNRVPESPHAAFRSWAGTWSFKTRVTRLEARRLRERAVGGFHRGATHAPGRARAHRLQTRKAKSNGGEPRTRLSVHVREGYFGFFFFFWKMLLQGGKKNADGGDLVRPEIWGDFRGAAPPRFSVLSPRPWSPAQPQRAFSFCGPAAVCCLVRQEPGEGSRAGHVFTRSPGSS